MKHKETIVHEEDTFCRKRSCSIVFRCIGESIFPKSVLFCQPHQQLLTHSSNISVCDVQVLIGSVRPINRRPQKVSFHLLTRYTAQTKVDIYVYSVASRKLHGSICRVHVFLGSVCRLHYHGYTARGLFPSRSCFARNQPPN